MRSRIIFFTQSYPFSTNYSWKKNELVELAKHFDVEVIPFIFSKPKLADFPQGIKVHKPLLGQLNPVKTHQVRHVLFSPRALFYLREFFRKKLFSNKKWLIEWLGRADRIEFLLKRPVIDELRSNRNDNQDTILYFYWGVGAAILVPFLAKCNFKKIVVRFHGFDLYEERKIGYIPFRHDLLKNLDEAVYISEAGLKYAHEKYPGINFKSHVFKLGSKHAEAPDYTKQETFRMVSCSNVIPLKQVDLIAKSLNHVNFNVEWCHLGDGADFEKLKQICEKLPPNIQVNLKGRVAPEKVLEIYSKTQFDLFVNFSLSEGLPVSIMEALSAGIPVLATDVGGTAEIVNSQNGKLISPDIDDLQLSQEITRFWQLSDKQIFDYRKAALNTYHEKCDFDLLTAEFIEFLKKD